MRASCCVVDVLLVSEERIYFTALELVDLIYTFMKFGLFRVADVTNGRLPLSQKVKSGRNYDVPTGTRFTNRVVSHSNWFSAQDKHVMNKISSVCLTVTSQIHPSSGQIQATIDKTRPF